MRKFYNKKTEQYGYVCSVFLYVRFSMNLELLSEGGSTNNERYLYAHTSI